VDGGIWSATNEYALLLKYLANQADAHQVRGNTFLGCVMVVLVSEWNGNVVTYHTTTVEQLLCVFESEIAGVG